MTNTQFDRWDIDNSGSWDLPQWFNSFMNEQIPRKRFKPYNHSIRKRQSFSIGINPSCDDCIFDDDDLETIEGYMGYKSIWQQYDQ